MVSFWPWKGDDNSPASFEKTLSTLSAKITRTSSRLDSIRQRSRRLSVLWTLYAGFAYLLYTIILVLVVGWRNWGPAEYAAVTGGPVIIYLIRRGLSTYYDYRASSIQGQLEELQKQRDMTIKKLKTATKYDSTQELLKKYGGTPTPKAKPTGKSDRENTAKEETAGTPATGRTGLGPPPTANIPGRGVIHPVQNSPQRTIIQSGSPLEHQPAYSPVALPPFERSISPQEAFAPNAFSSPPQFAQVNEGSRWYDRIMDVLLGEDETLPRARLALICSKCRLVNGQAPPGVKRLEDVGKWRCGGCGTMNGGESEAKEIVAKMKKQAFSDTEPTAKHQAQDRLLKEGDMSNKPTTAIADEDHESDITQYTSESSEEGVEAQGSEEKALDTVEEPLDVRHPRRSTRTRKGAKKAG